MTLETDEIKDTERDRSDAVDNERGYRREGPQSRIFSRSPVGFILVAVGRQAQGHYHVLFGFPVEIWDLERDVTFIQIWITLVSCQPKAE